MYTTDEVIFWFVVQYSTIVFTGIWLLLYLIFKCDKKCCGTFYVVFQILVFVAACGWALCTCFDANSTVHIIKQQDYELFIMNNQLGSDNFDNVNNYNITSQDLVIQTQLKDIEVGDWIFNVNPYTHKVPFIYTLPYCCNSALICTRQNIMHTINFPHTEILVTDQNEDSLFMVR